MLFRKQFLLGLIIGLASLTARAQRSAFITVNNNTVLIDNVFLQDSIVGGRLLNNASFTLNITDAASLQPILNAIQSGIAKNATTDFVLTYTNGFSNKFTERVYRSANVLSAKFEKLAGDSRNVLKLEVKIRSTQMNVNANAVEKKTANGMRAIMASNYMVDITGLPGARVANISGLEFKNNSLLSLEIGIADFDAWFQWLNSPSKKMNGSIYLLAPNMRDRVMQFVLQNIEIVSISQTVIDGTERTSRFTVLLKPAMVSFNEIK